VAARTGRLRAPAFMISPIKNTRSKIGSGAPTSSGGSPSTLWPSACTTPDVQPFTTAWTDVPPDERARSTMHYHWSRWASWTPSDWTLEFAVISDGEVAGTQGIGGRDSAVLREVHTGSWLGRRYQGQGIGTQMRAAVLHLAFEGLGAQDAASGAFEHNAASLGVSRKLRATAATADPGRLAGRTGPVLCERRVAQPQPRLSAACSSSGPSCWTLVAGLIPVWHQDHHERAGLDLPDESVSRLLPRIACPDHRVDGHP
jgi:RimJ/RimL family protein N-acetyltransferase